MDDREDNTSRYELQVIKTSLAQHEARLASIEERLVSYFQLVNEVRSSVLLLTREQEHLVKILEFTTTETHKTMDIIKKHIVEEFENQLKQGYRVDRLIKSIMFTGVVLVIFVFAIATAFPDIIKFLKPLLGLVK
jgi:hypothetical protein